MSFSNSEDTKPPTSSRCTASAHAAGCSRRIELHRFQRAAGGYGTCGWDGGWQPDGNSAGKLLRRLPRNRVHGIRAVFRHVLPQRRSRYSNQSCRAHQLSARDATATATPGASARAAVRSPARHAAANIASGAAFCASCMLELRRSADGHRVVWCWRRFRRRLDSHRRLLRRVPRRACVHGVRRVCRHVLSQRRRALHCNALRPHHIYASHAASAAATPRDATVAVAAVTTAGAAARTACPAARLHILWRPFRRH